MANPRFPLLLVDTALQAIVGMDVDSEENMAIALQTAISISNKVIMMYDMAGKVKW
jgi:hypothetical protein